MLRTVQAAGQMYFFFACVGSRDDASSPSRVLAMGTLQDVLDLTLDDGTELRRLYMLPVPLYGIGDLECQRVFNVMRRTVAAPDGVTHMLFLGSGQTETVPRGREQDLVVSSGLDEFEEVLDLPLPNFDEFWQQIQAVRRVARPLKPEIGIGRASRCHLRRMRVKVLPRICRRKLDRDTKERKPLR